MLALILMFFKVAGARPDVPAEGQRHVGYEQRFQT